jgi:hypothetical protein
MTGSTEVVVANPLASSSSQVAGTSARSIVFEPEPEPVAAEGEMAESAGADLAEEGVDASPAAVTKVETEPSMTQTDPIAEMEHHAAGTAEDLRAAVEEGVSKSEAACEGALHVFEHASHTMKTALDEAGAGATMLTFKLVEFAQANTQNTLDLARDYAAVRSIPDALNVQAAYIRRQFALLTAQTEELRRLTAKLTEKTAAPFKMWGGADV